MLDQLDVTARAGLEIGPLMTPLVLKTQGRIIYVDHATTSELREKYKSHEAVDVDAIAEIDAVWGDKSIEEALTGFGKVDYVLASHVIEHVPDVVTWLNELASVLTDEGTIRLAIPDRRFCFDYLREETRLTDILTAFAMGARRPQAREIIDYVLQYRQIDLERAWRGELETSGIEPTRLEHSLDLVRRSLAGEYVDVHCWTFTLSSFARIMAQLSELGLVSLACDRAFDTEVGEHEFFVTLRRADPVASTLSWWSIAAEAAGPKSPARETWPEARMRRLRFDDNEELNRLRVQVAELGAQVANVYASTSWKLSRPIRVLGGSLKWLRTLIAGPA
jgi:hypothetical protein